jgi:hypothetical protein
MSNTNLEWNRNETYGRKKLNLWDDKESGNIWKA